MSEPILGSREFRVRDLDKEFGNLGVEAASDPASAASSGSVSAAPVAVTAASNPRTSSNLGWLLRLFKSDFFDAWMAVTYLYRYRGSPGVQDYLCNELYSLADADLETYLPQICNLLLYHARDCIGLERFVLDKCADSVHLALQVYWFMEAAVADAISAGKRDVEAHCRLLRARCETAAINGGAHSIMMFARRKVRDAAGVQGLIMDPDGSPPASASARRSAGPGSGENFVLEESLADRSRLSRVTITASVGAETGVAVSTDGAGSVGGEGMGRSNSDGVVHELQFAERRSVFAASSGLPVPLLPEAEDPEGSDFGDFHSAEGDELSRRDEPLRAELERGPETPAVDIDDITKADPSILVSVKQERFSYFDDTLMLVKKLVKFSLEIRELPIERRPAVLKSRLNGLNDLLLVRMAGPDHQGEVVPEVVAANGEFSFLRSVHLPLVRANDHVLRVLRINPDETVILNTKTKAPYMLFIEVVETKMFCNNKGIFAEHFFAEEYIEERKHGVVRSPEHESSLEDRSVTTGGQTMVLSPGAQFIAKMQDTHGSTDPHARLRQNVKSAIYGDPEHVSFGERLIGFEAILDDLSEEAIDLSKKTISAVYGELWRERQDRILRASPFGVIPATKLMAFIVKAGDDLRQEQLAIQLIAQFNRIFEEEKVDVYLRPFTIMCSNAESGLVECLTDAQSLHSIKKKTPNFVSVRDYYERAFGPVNSIRFQQAQKGFIESMAGYSLVSYFLMILDRHNGNIMLDASGRVIHIDFGYMLGNSPGAIRFESAPFKLTDELIEVMATRNDQGFNYFKELVVLGFLAARKHHEKICKLVEVMMEGTSMPCMAGGQQVVEDLRSRFFLGLPENECVQRVLGLIDESYNNWRSRQYDRFQYMTNGIL